MSQGVPGSNAPLHPSLGGRARPRHKWRCVVMWCLCLFSSQAAQSVNKALEQFVKPEQLDGENSYKCSKYAG